MKDDGGYTYLTMLIVVFAVTLTAQTTWMPASTISIREREQELLFRGEAYRQAIASYYFADLENLSLPHSLDDLLDDPRTPGRRHIRKLYLDPVSQEKWAVIFGDNGIIGVSPSSDRQPMKLSGFRVGQEHFDNSQTYSDWHFVISLEK